MKDSDKSNVIDLGAKRKEKQLSQPERLEEQGEFETDILDITEMRQEILDDERRDVRRTILTGFIGAFVVVPGHGLVRVDIYDISEDGVAFDMESENGNFNSGEEVAMRVYLNQYTYFAFVTTIQNVRGINENEHHRHGASFVKGTVNDEALYHFVKFIETVSASLERDNGDVMVSQLKKK